MEEKSKINRLFIIFAFTVWAPHVAFSQSTCKQTPILLENFSDESIASSRINPARWTAHTPWGGDFGDAKFMNPGPGGPFSVDRGILSITARKNHEGTWNSGLIAAADATGAGSGAQYGYFEVRMKLPSGPGVWPAFWLMPLKPINKYDTRVEIDVIEYYGHDPSKYHIVVHVWDKDPKKTRAVGKEIAIDPNSLERDFHTFGVNISTSDLTFFLDGRAVWSTPTPPELDSPMYPLANLALGSGWPIDKTPNPSTLQIDYIHVYGNDGHQPLLCVPSAARLVE